MLFINFRSSPQCHDRHLSAQVLFHLPPGVVQGKNIGTVGTYRTGMRYRYRYRTYGTTVMYNLKIAYDAKYKPKCEKPVLYYNRVHVKGVRTVGTVLGTFKTCFAFVDTVMVKQN